MCGGGEKGQRKEKEGGGSGWEGCQAGKKEFFGISHESRRQDLASLFQNTRTYTVCVYMISVFSPVSSAQVVGATFLFKQFDWVTVSNMMFTPLQPLLHLNFSHFNFIRYVVCFALKHQQQQKKL